MEALLEKLEEECECPICSEIFQQPKTFICLHTFCLPCLNILAERHRANGFVPCPKCRKQIPIPDDGTFDTATSSFLHNRLVELLNIRTSSHKNISCGNCKKETADCSFCFECCKIYCGSCVEAHAVLKAEHKVRVLKDFHSEDYQDFLQRPMLCSEKFHESQPLVFYCKHCQTCLCQLCVVIKQKMHSEHDIISVVEAAEMKKISLLTNIGKLEQKKQLLDKGIQEMDKALSEIDENVHSAKAEVKRFTDVLIANILQRSETSLAELETVRTARKDIANQKKMIFVEESEQVNDAIKFGTTLIDSKATKELLREAEINKHFEDLLNRGRDIMEETKVNTFVKFIPGNEARFIRTETHQIGQIYTHCWDPSTSHLLNEAMAENQAALKVSGLSVVTKTSVGERHYLPTDKVELNVEPSMDVFDLQVTNHMTASYELSFVPRVPGRYEVQVKLNGHNIAGSPVEIFVTERKLTRLCSYNMPGGGEMTPVGVAVSKEGEIAVSDLTHVINHCIVIFDKNGNFLRKLSHSGNKEGELRYPIGIAFNSRDEIVVADSENHRIQVLDKRSGGVIRTFGRRGSAAEEFNWPAGVHVDETDRVIVTDYDNNKVQVFDEKGKLLFRFGDKSGKLDRPYHCVSYQDSFIVADSTNHVIKVYDNEGRFLYKFGECGKQDGQFDYPRGLAVDGHGNLFVCDQNNNCVQMFSVDGRFIGKTTCKLQGPRFAALLDDDKLVISEYVGEIIKYLKTFLKSYEKKLLTLLTQA